MGGTVFQCQLHLVSQGKCRNKVAVYRSTADGKRVGLCKRHDTAVGDIVGPRVDYDDCQHSQTNVLGFCAYCGKQVAG